MLTAATYAGAPLAAAFLRRTDEELRDDVSETLSYDTRIDSDAIHVDVHDGVVVLRGSLSSYDEIRFAIADAFDVEGGVGVRNELRLRRG